jgi:hypothetical protein
VFWVVTPVIAWAAVMHGFTLAMFWVVTPVIPWTAVISGFTVAVIWIAKPGISTAAVFFRIAEAVRVRSPGVAVNKTAFPIRGTHTELRVIMVVITRAAFFGAIANAVIVLPEEFLITTFIHWIARWAIWVLSPSLTWAAIEF